MAGYSKPNWNNMTYNPSGASQNQYNRAPYSPQYRDNRPPKKSGASKRTYTPTEGPNKGNVQSFTHGWKKTRQGFISISCKTTSKSELSEKGWYGHVACNVVNMTTGETNLHWGCMEKSTGKVIIDKLAIVINPKAPNGGYCGSYLKRSRR
jgi:hypothetical protein